MACPPSATGFRMLLWAWGRLVAQRLLGPPGSFWATGRGQKGHVPLQAEYLIPSMRPFHVLSSPPSNQQQFQAATPPRETATSTAPPTATATGDTERKWEVKACGFTASRAGRCLFPQRWAAQTSAPALGTAPAPWSSEQPGERRLQ